MITSNDAPTYIPSPSPIVVSNQFSSRLRAISPDILPNRRCRSKSPPHLPSSLGLGGKLDYLYNSAGYSLHNISHTKKMRNRCDEVST